MDKKVLEVLVCPKCKGKLEFDKKANELICQQDALAFPIQDGIPVMLEEEARSLNSASKSGPKSGPKSDQATEA